VSNTAAWVDTGFLVALFAKDDKHHESAQQFLKKLGKIELHSIWPVVVEACFFLDTKGKSALLSWIERGSMTLHDLDIEHLPNIRINLEKYQNLDPDFTDTALVTLAGILGIRKILTVDTRDFSAYRLSDGSYFERLWI
jgi:predicted nucleic acid-binding protein